MYVWNTDTLQQKIEITDLKNTSSNNFGHHLKKKSEKWKSITRTCTEDIYNKKNLNLKMLIME